MHVWKESEEQYLIDSRLQREGKFSGTKYHDIIWGEIATVMKKWYTCYQTTTHQ